MKFNPLKLIFFQMPPGLNLMCGPDSRPLGPDPHPLKLKKMKTRRKKEMERRRKPLKQERQRRREEKEQRRADRREEKKQQRAAKGEPEVSKPKAKRDPKSNHGTEQVDRIILKLLGKSHKSRKVAGKGQKKAVEGKKVVTQEKTVGSKWKPGMKEMAAEGWQEERKLKQKAESARSSKKEETSDLTMPETEKEESVTTNSEDGMVMEDIGSDPEADLLDSPKSGVDKTAFQEAFEEMLASQHSSPPPSFEETLISQHPPPSFEEPLISQHPSPSNPATQSPGSDAGLTLSSSEDEASSDHQEEKHSAKSKPKRYLKRRPVKKTTPSAESSDDQDEEPTQQRRRKVRKVNPVPSLTESSSGEIPNLTESDNESRESGVENLKGKVGNMNGGAGETYEEVLVIAIRKAGEDVKLDEPTTGDGSCFSHAIIQQCRRRPVKLFLQSRGVTITDFMHLKKQVAHFIQANINTPKVQNLKVNFEVSQLNMHWEGRMRRSWRQYWSDMQKHGQAERYWADDIFLQATALYLNLDIRIIWAGDNTNGQLVTTVDGLFYQVAQGESRPLLYLGYIVNEHYQSLLPVVEDDYMPPCLAQPAVDNALQNALQALIEEKTKQDNQVSS